MGLLEGGHTPKCIDFAHGRLNIGEPMAVPVIRELKEWQTTSPEVLEIRDAPPGASCPVVETVRDADFALLVTEPTPFGLHDLKQVSGMVRELGIPAGVVLNRCDIGDQSVESYCDEIGLPILMSIPMERRIAEALAAGEVLSQAFPEFTDAFLAMYESIRAAVES
jgi:MinD superfamily P-loop ATPase